MISLLQVYWILSMQKDGWQSMILHYYIGIWGKICGQLFEKGMERILRNGFGSLK